MLDAYFAAQFEGGRHEHRIEKMAIPCGAAGDAAAARLSQHAMLPTDLIDELGGLFLKLEK